MGAGSGHSTGYCKLLNALSFEDKQCICGFSPRTAPCTALPGLLAKGDLLGGQEVMLFYLSTAMCVYNSRCAAELA